MSEFIWIPDNGFSETHEPRTRKVQFLDTYEQRAGSGINTDLAKWNLTFSGRTAPEARAIADFLSEMAGVTAFRWAPPKKGKPYFENLVPNPDSTITNPPPGIAAAGLEKFGDPNTAPALSSSGWARRIQVPPGGNAVYKAITPNILVDPRDRFFLQCKCVLTKGTGHACVILMSSEPAPNVYDGTGDATSSSMSSPTALTVSMMVSDGHSILTPFMAITGGSEGAEAWFNRFLFYIQPSRLVVCNKWTITPSAFNSWTVTAEFYEVLG